MVQVWESRGPALRKGGSFWDCVLPSLQGEPAAWQPAPLGTSGYDSFVFFFSFALHSVAGANYN